MDLQVSEISHNIDLKKVEQGFFCQITYWYAVCLMVFQSFACAPLWKIIKYAKKFGHKMKKSLLQLVLKNPFLHLALTKPETRGFSDTLSVTSYIWTIRCWSQNWRGFYFPFPRRRYCNAESVERAQRKKAETLNDKTHYMALCDGAVFLFYNFDISSLLLEVCLCCWLQSLISEIQKTDNFERFCDKGM